MTDDVQPHDTPDPAEGRTQDYPTFVYGPTAPEANAVDPATDDDAGDEWPIRAPARGIRLALPTAGLAGVLLVAGGFWGGAALQKSQGSSGSQATSGIAARFRAALTGTSTTGTSTTGTTTGATGTGGGGGFGFGGGGFSGTVGTISVVDGDTLYVLTAAGALVKVTLGSSVTISRNAKAQAVGLRPGDTVVVQGAAAANGDVTATSVAASAPGVTSAGGGFGRGGSGGGAAGGGSAGGSGAAAGGG